MADRPIIFSASMVRALLAREKWMTRRILNPQPPISDTWNVADLDEDHVMWLNDKGLHCRARIPFSILDHLWVRETCRAAEDDDGYDFVEYKADGARHGIGSTVDAAGRWLAISYYDEKRRGRCAWVPAIHAPRWTSRITLDVTAVKVERLQAISEEDAIAEGVCETEFYAAAERKVSAGAPMAAEVLAFADLWQSIHGRGAWDRNPWIFATSLGRTDAPQAA